MAATAGASQRRPGWRFAVSALCAAGCALLAVLIAIPAVSTLMLNRADARILRITGKTIMMPTRLMSLQSGSGGSGGNARGGSSASHTKRHARTTISSTISSTTSAGVSRPNRPDSHQAPVISTTASTSTSSVGLQAVVNELRISPAVRKAIERASRDMESVWHTIASQPTSFRDICHDGSCNMVRAPLLIHHIKHPSVFKLLDKYAARDMPRTTAPRLFCWVWVRPREDRDAASEYRRIPRLLQQFSECDGWALFSNFADARLNITKAHEGPSGGNSRSAVQFHSIMDHLVHDAAFSGYDWYVSLEPDHFMRLRLLRRILGTVGSEAPRHVPARTANIYSSGYLRAVRQEWHTVGERHQDGCPIYANHSFYLKGKDCQGDITMPLLSSMLRSRGVAVAGGRGILRLLDFNGYLEMQHIGKDWDLEELQRKFICGLLKLIAEPLCHP